MSKRHIYLISGLGADERVFERLVFPADCEVHYLPWITPLNAGEPIGEYAGRMARRILHPEPILVGLSFGGMMSIEIARQLPVRQVVLISSVKSRQELPPYYNSFANKVLNRLPDRLLFTNRRFVVQLFMQCGSEAERRLLDDYLGKKDLRYMRWALGAILQWNNDWTPPGLLHIHGSSDRPFPRRYVTPTHTILKGGHFMIMNRAPEISTILEKNLL
ncbi:alpha/beta fold hydrolase [Chitinophaga pollutisoli]|uniref:Alpha/beta fold hydrolase n=1 Tax=Chitinophaga pollutisoli TaxID=3133966 RepID=A0ABZ2YTR9_9BACT